VHGLGQGLGEGQADAGALDTIVSAPRRSNGWKRRSMSCAAIPHTVSATVHTRVVGVARRSKMVTVPSSRLYLMALETK